MQSVYEHENYTNVFPQDANDRGTIFGGKLFSEMDLTVAQHCHILLLNTECEDAVTVAANNVIFHDKAVVGDVLKITSKLVKIGIKSLTFDVDVYAIRKNNHFIKIATATLVFVARKNGVAHKHGIQSK